MRVRLGGSSAVTLANADGSGLFIANKLPTAPTTVTMYRNDVSLGSVSQTIDFNLASQLQITIGRQGASSFAWEARKYRAALCGRGMTTAELTAIYSALDTFFTAIGVP